MSWVAYIFSFLFIHFLCVLLSMIVLSISCILIYNFPCLWYLFMSCVTQLKSRSISYIWLFSKRKSLFKHKHKWTVLKHTQHSFTTKLNIGTKEFVKDWLYYLFTREFGRLIHIGLMKLSALLLLNFLFPMFLNTN